MCDFKGFGVSMMAVEEPASFEGFSVIFLCVKFLLGDSGAGFLAENPFLRYSDVNKGRDRSKRPLVSANSHPPSNQLQVHTRIMDIHRSFNRLLSSPLLGENLECISYISRFMRFILHICCSSLYAVNFWQQLPNNVEKSVSSMRPVEDFRSLFELKSWNRKENSHLLSHIFSSCIQRRITHQRF